MADKARRSNGNPTTKKAKSLTFSVKTPSLEEAAPMFRTAVGIVLPLAHGLLGRKPKAAEDLGIDLREHEKFRKFSTEAELEEFYRYLEGLLAHARELGHDKLASVELNKNGAFVYKSANGRAEIALIPIRGAWRVQGSVSMLDPTVCAKALSSNGFSVRVSA